MDKEGNEISGRGWLREEKEKKSRENLREKREREESEGWEYSVGNEEG